MSKSKWTWYMPIVVVIFFATCKKSDTATAHNQNLLDKNVSQIKTAIAGNWQVKRSEYVICPFIGPCFPVDSFYLNNNGDLFSFSFNNTIKLTGSTGTPVRFDEQATVVKIRLGTPVDSAYVFKIATGNHQYLMKEIRNDSLIISDRGVDYWLTKKL